jgi:hypothetical protein
MKKSIIIPFLFVSAFAFSQGSNITYDLQGANPTTTDATTNLKLPLKLMFTDKFNDKSIKFTSEDGTQTLALNNAKFGIGDLTKDGSTNQFVITINQDRTVNPGDEKINADKFTLQIEQSKIPLSLLVIHDDKIDGTKKDEEYEAGYVYYDVMKLLDKNSNDKLKLSILGSYGVDKTTVKDNPYLKAIFTELYNKGLPEDGGGTLLSTLGNADVTYFAEGLARFLAERTKEELNEAFFNKMKEQLNTYPELKTAFPKTVSFLDQIETFSYASILNSLRDAFEMDVQNLPENLYNIKGLTDGDCDKVAICGKEKNCDNFTECQARLKKLSEFFASQDGRWVALGMLSLKEGIKADNPATLLKTIATSTEFSDLKTTSTTNKKYDDYNVASSVELSNLISQSFISKDDNHVWISTAQLNSLLNSKMAMKVYLGLLLSKELSAETKTIISFYKTDNSQITFGTILQEAYKDYKKYEPQVSSLIKNTYASYNATNNAVKKMIAASGKSVDVDPQALYDYYTTLTTSLKPVAHNPLLIAIVGKDIGIAYDKVEKFLNPSVDMAYHISTKKYSAAIYDASVLLSALNDYKITTTNKKGKTKEEKYDGFKTVTKSFIKYGTLISTVANAQSSEEVKQALDASVLPVGSYSIKRKTNWSMSINSYVGAFWSYSNTATSKDYLPALGLAAPIGFNISKGFSKTGNCGGLSLNLQILDVGALVNYYLLKGDTATIPNDFKVRLSNIFSPGFNLSYNIPKTPLSFTWGGQYIPTLYKYEQINGVNELTPTNAWRWQISLLVDIPMYNLKVWDFKK